MPCSRRLTLVPQANGYRLPTEAEWEYAARGGAASRGFTYAGGNYPGPVTWLRDNSQGTTQPAATRAPNELGLPDRRERLGVGLGLVRGVQGYRGQRPPGACLGCDTSGTGW